MNPENMQSNIEQKQLLEIARENFKRWNDALQTKDQNKVAALYATDSVFLPTQSREIKEGSEGAQEYFLKFLEQNPTGTITEDHVKSYGQDAFLHAGNYDFEVEQNGIKRTIHARFTFMWQKGADGLWRIDHHHSSQQPE